MTKKAISLVTVLCILFSIFALINSLSVQGGSPDTEIFDPCESVDYGGGAWPGNVSVTDEYPADSDYKGAPKSLKIIWTDSNWITSDRFYDSRSFDYGTANTVLEFWFRTTTTDILDPSMSECRLAFGSDDGNKYYFELAPVLTGLGLTANTWIKLSIPFSSAGKTTDATSLSDIRFMKFSFGPSDLLSGDYINFTDVRITDKRPDPELVDRGDSLSYGTSTGASWPGNVSVTDDYPESADYAGAPNSLKLVWTDGGWMSSERSYDKLSYAYSEENMALEFWFRTSAIEILNMGECRIAVGNGDASKYYFDLTAPLKAAGLQKDTWVKLVLPFSSAGILGAPSLDNIVWMKWAFGTSDLRTDYINFTDVRIKHYLPDPDILDRADNLDYGKLGGGGWNPDNVSVTDDYPSSDDYKGAPHSLKITWLDSGFITSARGYDNRNFVYNEENTLLEFWFRSTTTAITAMGECRAAVGTDDSNMYYFDIGTVLTDAGLTPNEWIKISIFFSDAGKAGTPSLSDISWMKFAFGSSSLSEDYINVTDIRIKKYVPDPVLLDRGDSLNYGITDADGWNHGNVSVSNDCPGDASYKGVPGSLKIIWTPEGGGWISSVRSYDPISFTNRNIEADTVLEFWFRTSTTDILTMDECRVEIGIDGVNMYRFHLAPFLTAIGIQSNKWVKVAIPFSEAEKFGAASLSDIRVFKFAFGSTDLSTDYINFTDIKIRSFGDETEPDLGPEMIDPDPSVLERGSSLKYRPSGEDGWNPDIVSVTSDYPESTDYTGVQRSLRVNWIPAAPGIPGWITASRGYYPRNFAYNEANAVLEFWFRSSTTAILDMEECRVELGTDGLNMYRFSLVDALKESGFQSNQWVKLSIPFGVAGKFGSASLSDIRSVKFAFGPTDLSSDYINFTDVRIKHYTSPFAANQLDDCQSAMGWNFTKEFTDGFKPDELPDLNGSLRVERDTGDPRYITTSKGYPEPRDFGITKADGILEFWLYISDPAILKSDSVEIELYSPGNTDGVPNMFRFLMVNSFRGGTTPAGQWTKVSLNFKTAFKYGKPDITKINGIKLAVHVNNKEVIDDLGGDLSRELYLNICDIRFKKAAKANRNFDVITNCDDLNGFHNNTLMTLDKADKVTGQSSVNVKTDILKTATGSLTYFQATCIFPEIDVTKYGEKATLAITLKTHRPNAFQYSTGGIIELSSSGGGDIKSIYVDSGKRLYNEKDEWITLKIELNEMGNHPESTKQKKLVDLTAVNYFRFYLMGYENLPNYESVSVTVDRVIVYDADKPLIDLDNPHENKPEEDETLKDIDHGDYNNDYNGNYDWGDGTGNGYGTGDPVNMTAIWVIVLMSSVTALISVLRRKNKQILFQPLNNIK